VLVNLWALLDRAGYDKAGFYLNTFVGTNIFFAVFLLCFTFAFGFCYVSRAAAVAEFLFAVVYLIIQQDNIYNILFQVITGCIALFLTFKYFGRKYPLCDIGLLNRFFGWVVLTGSCSKGLDRWESETKSIVKLTHHAINHIHSS
jgi:hypothetical protein